jgi:hypothetical protein
MLPCKRLVWLLVPLMLLSCALPGLVSPTPLAYPSPDLTHTAIYATLGSTEAMLTETPTLPSVPTLAPTAPIPVATAGAHSQRPNGSPITAGYRSSPPTIDGDLGEWSPPANAIDYVVFGAANWGGASDLSAAFYIGWDMDNLYIAVRVTDNAFVQISTGELLYRGDSAEIQVDADLNVDYAVNSLNSDDYQLGFSPGNFSALPPMAYRWYPIEKSGALPEVIMQSMKTIAGWDLEASIPWNVLGISPSIDGRYGFTLSVSDNDLAGTSTQQTLLSNVSTRTTDDPTTWGTLILGP